MINEQASSVTEKSVRRIVTSPQLVETQTPKVEEPKPTDVVVNFSFTVEPKKVRNMTAKGWLHKANNGKISAGAFLDAHREFLNNQNGIKEQVEEVYEMLDLEEIKPTPALQKMIDIVVTNIISAPIVTSENASRGPRKVYPHMATIFNSKHEIVSRTKEDGSTEELVSGYELPQQAVRWSHRRLVECSSDCYAVVVHSNTNQKTVVTRQDAIASVFVKPKQPFQKKSGGSHQKLWAKVKNDRSSFSRG